MLARLRPFILQRDPIHYGKVLTSIGYLLNEEDRVTAAPTLDGLRKSWNKVASPSDEVGAYSVHVTQTGGETSVMNADRLAFAWIYGDTIHADPIHQSSAEVFGIQERFRAATGIVAGLIINTIATLNVVLALNEGGRLTITGSVLDRDVVVKTADYRQEVAFYLGEPDAEPPSRLDEPLGAQWTPVGELADLAGLSEETTPVTTQTHEDEPPEPVESAGAAKLGSTDEVEGAAEPPSFTQSDDIVDHVFAIFNVEHVDAGLKPTEFLGTGFFIGSHSYALTAKHVMRNAKTPAILMRDASRTGWHAFAVKEHEPHPSEDVSLLRIEDPWHGSWRSIFGLPNRHEGSSMTYFLFGYPDSAMREIVEDGMARMRPDLIYSEGHVRRRMTDIPLPVISGTQLFELSQVAGAGCSGSPVINKRSLGQNAWQLVGVYIGERLDEDATSVGYAARLAELSDWKPDMLSGRTLGEEANDNT